MKVLKILLEISAVILLISGCNTNSSVNITEDTQNTNLIEESIVTTTEFIPESIIESITESASAAEPSVMDMVQKIKDRSLCILKNADNLELEDDGFYSDYYDGNNLVLRTFALNPEKLSIDETYTVFYLYYDEFGKLNFGSVGHYRSLAFEVYFQDDEIIYIDCPFEGELEDVIEAIRNSEKYSIILDDIACCLENAYKPISSRSEKK